MIFALTAARSFAKVRSQEEKRWRLCIVKVEIGVMLLARFFSQRMLIKASLRGGITTPRMASLTMAWLLLRSSITICTYGKQRLMVAYLVHQRK